jgi:predicted nucleic acid-binding protein
MIAVVDTSVVIRLFIPDGPVPKGVEVLLQGVESGDHVAIAPELMLAEAANVLHKKQLRGEISGPEASELAHLIAGLPIRHFRHHPLIEGALELAVGQALTVYDALFLELARQKGARLYSADEKLLQAALHLGMG